MESKSSVNTLPPLPSNANGSSLPLPNILPGVDGLPLSMKENHPFGAAFSLASLDQGNSRSSLSLMNLNMGFDHTVFLKSGSFDSLNALLGSQLFGKDSNTSLLASINPNLSTAPLTPSNILNDSLHKNTLVQISPSSHSGQHPNLSMQGNANPNPLNSSSNQVNVKSMLPTPIQSNVISTIPSMSPSHSNNAMVNGTNNTGNVNNNIVNNNHQLMTYGNNALIQPRENEKRMMERKDDASKFVDVTPFLTLPQHEAAKKLGIPSSTLAKRWKEASCNRKWPYRTVSKLDKEILTLLKNVENAKSELSPSVEANLGLLLKRRQEELKTVLVRL